jgi:hypothetical protein
MKIGPERTERFGESGKAKSSEGEGIGAKKKKKKKKKTPPKKKKKGDLEG